ncbi:MAG: ubiquinol-cytochrome c reductase iron-sulfur subunit [Pseudomonadota bacterium]
MNASCTDRRRLLIATSGAGALAAAATAAPFLSSFAPSERARAAGAPVEADVSKLAPGSMMTVEWRGKPVWILHRTPDMLAALARHEVRLADASSAVPQQPGYAANRSRAAREPFLVVIGICTHLGCSPTEKLASGADSGLGEDWPGGFLCPCHGSLFDLAGRVFRNQPAPTNLEVPPYQWLSDTRVLIGDDGRGEV